MNSDALNALDQAVVLARERAGDRPAIVGVAGPQGSGKTTLVSAYAAFHPRTAHFSLDDVYLPASYRRLIAQSVHPLFATRGPPGTHDVALGLETLDALARGGPAPLPRFDKAADDRLPSAEWPCAPPHCQVLLFEGWCLGARAQAPGALAEPVNPLERDEDPAAIWRTYANAALAGEYQRLFARIDRLILLAAPGWGVVRGWREEAEAKLRTQGPGAMTQTEIARFVQFYERITRWVLAEMPGRADVTVRLGPDRGPRLRPTCS